MILRPTQLGTTGKPRIGALRAHGDLIRNDINGEVIYSRVVPLIRHSAVEIHPPRRFYTILRLKAKVKWIATITLFLSSIVAIVLALVL